MSFEKFFIRFRINEVIRLLEEHDGSLPRNSLKLLRDKKYRHAISILEASGCIKVRREAGGSIIMIVTTNKGFSVYCLERHDVWVNRIGGFLCGVGVSIIGDLIIKFLL